MTRMLIAAAVFTALGIVIGLMAGTGDLRNAGALFLTATIAGGLGIAAGALAGAAGAADANMRAAFAERLRQNPPQRSRDERVLKVVEYRAKPRSARHAAEN